MAPVYKMVLRTISHEENANRNQECCIPLQSQHLGN